MAALLVFFRHSDKSGHFSLYIQFYKLLWLTFYIDFFLNLEFYYNDVEQGFLTGGTCTLGGTKYQSKGYDLRRQNNDYFKLFALNLFSMLLEIRKHSLKPFLTFAFLNDFLS